MTTLDISTLESWLWDAACKLRGPVDAPKFKDYILPLIFLKRLSDVFDDEVQRVAEEFAMPLDEALNEEEVLPPEEAVVRLREADRALREVLGVLGLDW